MKFSIKDFFSKCDQIRRKLRYYKGFLHKKIKSPECCGYKHDIQYHYLIKHCFTNNVVVTPTHLISNLLCHSKAIMSLTRICEANIKQLLNIIWLEYGKQSMQNCNAKYSVLYFSYIGMKLYEVSWKNFSKLF